MPLHAEQIVTDLRDYLRTNLAAYLALVAAESPTSLPLSTPAPDDFFIGERNRFRGYKTPAIFLITADVERPDEGMSGEWGTILRQEHHIYVDVLVEATNEEDLTRLAWRFAQAVDSCLHDVDITPDGVTTRATKVFIPSIEYDPAVSSSTVGERVFRKDVWVALVIRHWDLLTDLPIQIVGVGDGSVINLGAGGGNFNAMLFNEILTPDGATNIIAYTHPIRMGTNGKPQAKLLWKRGPQLYTTSGTPEPGEWTLSGDRTVVMGDIPAADDDLRFEFVIVQ